MTSQYADSKGCGTDTIDLFSLPPTQVAIDKVKWLEKYPVNAIVKGSPIDFNIETTANELLDLKETLLCFEVTITRANGDNIEAEEPVGFVNHPMTSIFKQVDVTLNGKRVSDSTPTYAHRSMIELLTNYGNDAKKSQLTMGLFYKDTAGNMNASNPYADNNANAGLTKRARFTAQSRTVQLVGKIHSDIFMQDRAMINNVKLGIKFYPQSDNFALMSSADNASYIYTIKNMCIKLKTIVLTPSVFLSIEEKLKNKTAKYPIRRIYPKVHHIARGCLSETINNAILGTLPERIVVGLISDSNYNGNYTGNPFDFAHHNVKQITADINGESVKMIRTDFTHAGQSIDGYSSLFSTFNRLGADLGNGLDRENFASGYALYTFNVNHLSNCDEVFEVKRKGVINLDFQFKTATTNVVVAFIYAEYENIIEVDRNRNIILDFGP